MPVMDGLEATRRIKSDRQGDGTAIVVLSASALEEDRRSVGDSGADGFLTKPCREDELFEKIRSLLDIEYAYEEDGEAPGLARQNLEKLGPLPLGLAEELRNATLGGNKTLLDKLILQVRDSESVGSANALQELADKYEYDTLTRLLDEACRQIS